jgi:hypothetical protein
MFYKAKFAVCSEIRTKHINAMWAPRRIFSVKPGVCKVTGRFYKVKVISDHLSPRNRRNMRTVNFDTCCSFGLENLSALPQQSRRSLYPHGCNGSCLSVLSLLKYRVV